MERDDAGSGEELVGEVLDVVGVEASGCAVGDGLDGVAAIERRGGGGEAVVAGETPVEAARSRRR